jgi:hypothetical protein
MVDPWLAWKGQPEVESDALILVTRTDSEGDAQLWATAVGFSR